MREEMKKFVFPLIALLLTGCDPCHTAKLVRTTILYDQEQSISKVMGRALEATAPRKHLTRTQEREIWEPACRAIRQKAGELFMYASFSYDLSRQISSWSKCRVRGGELCPAVAREVKVYADAHQIGLLLSSQLFAFCDKAVDPKYRGLADAVWLEGHRLRNQPMSVENGVVSVWGAVYELDRNTIPLACGPRAYREKPIVIGADCP
jgi:hypothetical protein